MDSTRDIPYSLEQVPASGIENPLGFLEEAMSGLRYYQAFVTAYERGLFEVCREPATLERIAAETMCIPAVAGPLCEGLVRAGLLAKNEAGSYLVTSHTRDFFLKNSPFSQEAALAQMRHYASLFLRLSDILTHGPVTYPRGEQFRQVIIPAMAESARCGFVQRVADMVSRLPEFRQARKLLDLGGGHGLYAIAFSQKNPDLTSVIFDLPEVAIATREYIRKYGAHDRISTHEGDFFLDPLGSGYDIIFSSSNPSGKMPALLPKIRAALNPGGLYINKQVIDEPEAEPFLDLEWSLWAFEGMPKQGSRFRFEGSVSLEEYNRILAESGFTVCDCIPVDKRSVMTIAKKIAE
jgi:predicted O-methyltransferase YrrM